MCGLRLLTDYEIKTAKSHLSKLRFTETTETTEGTTQQQFTVGKLCYHSRVCMCHSWYNSKDMYIISSPHLHCKFSVWNTYILWRNSITISVYEHDVAIANKKKETGARKAAWKKYF